MPSDTTTWIIAALTFISALLTLAVNMLPMAPDVKTWLLFGSAAIDLALTVFFGRMALRLRAAKHKAAK